MASWTKVDTISVGPHNIRLDLPEECSEDEAAAKRRRAQRDLISMMKDLGVDGGR